MGKRSEIKTKEVLIDQNIITVKLLDLVLGFCGVSGCQSLFFLEFWARPVLLTAVLRSRRVYAVGAARRSSGYMGPFPTIHHSHDGVCALSCGGSRQG